ncbi:uncharacterized protein AB675_3434 [Cyphellophora attinorum]|uniref:Uncharacterized protein n=1 Tax=Cyphellophora attinorum TaxID=1664694 RepID=A0A0N0NLV7_9EURO|nr:uncharacterized protein AB675_3434 [Phialophora attinorum]KPI39628.1 hypothetical protein AB675_3434 [Phialophora attinorum]
MASEMMAPPTPITPISPDTLTGVTALARFEFEAGRGNEGTKIPMVEWQAEQDVYQRGSWHVSWAGNRYISAEDRPSDKIQRSYFLLPPGSVVPPHIKLSFQPPETERDHASEPLIKTVKPLPAIFTPELGATAKASGKKGVLHTIWAKKRLQSLEKEIRHEQEHNLEGIALEMANAEKTWIQDNFGLQTKPSALEITSSTSSDQLAAPTSPALNPPRSPNSRRLSEKLKGLSLGTSEKDLARANTPTSDLHPLSPEVSDVAYSSFSTFRGGPASPQSASMATAPKRVVAHAPPASILRQQSGMEQTSSMDFLTSMPTSTDSVTTSDDPDDLFAVALSPRSPDLAKSPFSFSSAEVSKSNAQSKS